MKNTCKCPKCQSSSICRIVPSGGDSDAGGISIGLFNYTLPTIFLCSDCGYVEQWVEDERDLAKIFKKYKQYGA